MKFIGCPTAAVDHFIIMMEENIYENKLHSESLLRDLVASAQKLKVL